MKQLLDGEFLPTVDSSFIVKRLDSGDVAELGKDFNVILRAKIKERIEQEKVRFEKTLKSK